MPDASGSVDLSSLKGGGEATEFDALTADQQEALERMAAENPPEDDGKDFEGPLPITAFLVILGPDGHWDMGLVQIPMQRPPQSDDFVAAAAVMIKDITAQDAGIAASNMIHQQALKMQEQMQASQIAQQLQSKGGIRV